MHGVPQCMEALVYVQGGIFAPYLITSYDRE